jgi:two-component system response regulator VicR
LATTKKVLLVEDDAAINDAFSILLHKEGYRVETTFNGQEALEKLKTFQPDVILLDLLMPVMDGKQFLQAFDNPAQIPVIVFSNIDSKSEVQEALSLGATRYMLKAWASQKQLVQVINEAIGSQQAAA